MMVEYGDKRALSIDATFGTNEPQVCPSKSLTHVFPDFFVPCPVYGLTSFLYLQYPLYTVMVFDEWEQGIHVAYTVQGKSRHEDIVVWLSKLKARCLEVNPDWRPNVVVVDNDQAELNAIRWVFFVDVFSQPFTFQI